MARPKTTGAYRGTLRLRIPSSSPDPPPLSGKGGKKRKPQEKTTRQQRAAKREFKFFREKIRHVFKERYSEELIYIDFLRLQPENRINFALALDPPEAHGAMDAAKFAQQIREFIRVAEGTVNANGAVGPTKTA